MIQGSSALSFAGEKQVTTSFINASISEGRYIAGETVLAPRLGSLNGQNFFPNSITTPGPYNGVHFANRLVVIGATNGVGITIPGQMILSYPMTLGTSPTGVSMRDNYHLGSQTTPTGIQDSTFIIDGATLLLFYSSFLPISLGLSTTYDIYRLASGDGINFGGETRVYRVGPGSTYFSAHFSAVSKDELYLADGRSAPAPNYYKTFYVNIIQGITRALDLEWIPMPISAIGNRSVSGINARRLNNYDEIFFNVGTNINDFSMLPPSSSGIISIKTDTTNCMNRQLLLTGYNGTISNEISSMIPISRGVSYDYLGFFMRKAMYSFIGITQIATFGWQLFNYRLSRTEDLDWNLVQIFGNTYNSADKNTIIVAGSTNIQGSSAFEYIILTGTTDPLFYTRMGVSTLNISDHIINYSNSNNSRIKLTLGNFR